MNDEENLEENEEQEKLTRPDMRVKSLLSEKTKIEQERDAETKAKTEVEAKLAAQEKETNFYKDFSQASSKYSNATEYQDAIKEKVMSGYSVEDATVSVLAREGKLTMPKVPNQSPAGGSATNAIKSDGEKTIADMDQAERRAILEKNLDLI